MEAVRHVEQVVCENIWPKIIQHLRNDFGELTHAFGEINFGGIGKGKGCSHGPVTRLFMISLCINVPQRRGYSGFDCFAKNRTNPDVRVLQVWRRVSLQL